MTAAMVALWELSLTLALLIIIYGAARLIFEMLLPSKIRPDDFEDPNDWGEQPNDIRRSRAARNGAGNES